MSVMAYTWELGLPWESSTEDGQTFRRYLLICVAVVCFAGLIFPWLPLPEVDREELEELPPQLARILLEKPKPIPPPPAPKPEVKEEIKPKEPDPKPAPKTEPNKPQPKVTDAKEKAAISGLLAFKDSFADMRDAVDMSALQDTGAIQQGAGNAATIDRSLLTSKHSTRSAGVNVAALSRDTGGVALSGREITKVDVPKQSKGNGGARAAKTTDARQRSIEEIRRVFDSNKGAIFAIYNRALRMDPTLQGKVVLELVIDPTGRVTECRVVASEITDQTVVAKILKRVRLFDFGKRNVGTTKISYPVHFLPT